MSAQSTQVHKFLAVGQVSVKLETFQVKGSMPMSLNLKTSMERIPHQIQAHWYRSLDLERFQLHTNLSHHQKLVHLGGLSTHQISQNSANSQSSHIVTISALCQGRAYPDSN